MPCVEAIYADFWITYPLPGAISSCLISPTGADTKAASPGPLFAM
jgi:hypothetical protein